MSGFLLAVAGFMAAWWVPIDAIPDLSDDQVIVFAYWPGHAPGEVEEQVTYPLSLALQGLDGAKAVRTSSDFGASSLFVILQEGTDAGRTRREIAERIAEAPLPAGVRAKLGPDAAATGQIFWYTVEGGGLDTGRLRSIQDWTVGPRIARVPGVAEVAGGRRVPGRVRRDDRPRTAPRARRDDLASAIDRGAEQLHDRRRLDRERERRISGPHPGSFGGVRRFDR